MDVGVTFLSAIGYVPSFLPKSSKPHPKLLEDEASWNKLVKDVHKYRKNCKKKNKGKGQVPAFTISLTDTSNGDGKENKKVSIYYLYIYLYFNLLLSVSLVHQRRSQMNLQSLRCHQMRSKTLKQSRISKSAGSVRSITRLVLFSMMASIINSRFLTRQSGVIFWCKNFSFLRQCNLTQKYFPLGLPEG